MTDRKKPVWETTLIALVLIAGCAFLGFSLWWTQPWAAKISGIGGVFQLTSSRGDLVSDRSLSGKPFIVFFGFTHCPDICPTTLFQISEGLRAAGAPARKLPILFVTVDPERDTPDLLAKYLESFHPTIIGLTGSANELATMQRGYRVFAKRVPTANGLTYDHSTMVYLMSSSGTFLGGLDLDVSTQVLARALDAHASR
jgi:protein SCO1